MLINSLSKSEKRYFSLASDKRTIYYRLFEIYDQYENLNDPKIQKAIVKQQLNSYLTTHKSMLHERILSSLRDYYRDSSKVLKIKHLLIDIEILYERRLFEQCLKAITKASKYCVQSEELGLLMHVQNWERRIRFNYRPKVMGRSELTAFHEEENATMEKYQNYLSHRHFSDNLFTYYLEIGDSRTEYENEMFDELAGKRPGKEPITTGAKYKFYSALVLKSYAQRKYKESYELIKKTQKIIEQDPPFKEANPLLYGTVISNAVRVLMNLTESDKALEHLELIKEIPIKSLNDKVWLFQNYYLVKMTILSESGRLREAFEVAEFVSVHLQGFENNLNRRYWFYFRLAYIYFGNEDFSKSLKFINKLLALKEIRKDLQNAAHIINLIVHYELKNHELVVYGIKSVYRYLKRRSQLHQYEKVLLHGLGQMLRATRLGSDIDVFKMVLKNLQELDDQSPENYFHYRAWLSSKIGKTSYEQQLAMYTGNSQQEHEG